LAQAAVSSSVPSDAGDSWIRRRLQDLRDRSVKWSPRDTSHQRLVFSGSRLAALTSHEVLLLDGTGTTNPVRMTVEQPRKLARLADGSFLVLGAGATYVIRPNAKEPEPLNKVSQLPGHLVYASLSDPLRFDVFDKATGSLAIYRFNAAPGVSSLWLPRAIQEVPELQHASCVQLLDGALGCFARDQLWRWIPRGAPRSVGKPSPGLPVWRILAGPRADQIWLARDNGVLEQWWLGPPPELLTEVQLPWTPLDVAVTLAGIAVIRIVQERDEPKQLTLAVLDAHGKTRFEQPLHPTADDGSVGNDEELREAEVALHQSKPWAGVRTTRGVRLVNAITGTTISEAR
jgi:hypothetical protein